MDVQTTSADTPRLTRDDLLRVFEDACRAPDELRIGTENERFGFAREGFRPLTYDGEGGVRAFLNGMTRFGWTPIREGGMIIALASPPDTPVASLTLEPGGQIELSGAPLKTIHETKAELLDFERQIAEVGKAIGAGFLPLGLAPHWLRQEITPMPKARYAIMAPYLRKRGRLALDMMFRTCTAQTNLDVMSEADMVRKMRVALALQPVATALFANSPFYEGKPSGFLSTRAASWSDFAPERCGLLPFVFEDGFGFERYLDYALSVPMFFIQRGGEHLNIAGADFRQFMEGKLDALPGETPTIADFKSHLTTIFPEARLKGFIETRGADTGDIDFVCALSALWTGIFYDPAALEAAVALVRTWTEEERETLRLSAPKTALKTPFRKGSLNDIARDMLALAEDGLRARGENEEAFLAPLHEIVKTGETRADSLLARYHGEWKGDITRIFETAL